MVANVTDCDVAYKGGDRVGIVASFVNDVVNTNTGGRDGTEGHTVTGEVRIRLHDAAYFCEPVVVGPVVGANSTKSEDLIESESALIVTIHIL